MPISASAKKSLRVSERNHKINVSFKTTLRKSVKEYLAKPTAEGLKGIYSLLDKAVKNNIFHAHKTARLKSQYNKLIDTAGTKAAQTRKATKKTTKQNKAVAAKKAAKKTAKKM